MPAVFGMPEGGLSIGGFIDSVPGFAEALDEGIAERLEIFYDEDAHGVHYSVGVKGEKSVKGVKGVKGKDL